MANATIISVATQKGGSGKSTLTVLIATALHFRSKYKVLVIDADFQQTIVDNRTQDGESENIYTVIPFNYQTHDFLKFITKVAPEYDVIIIDTPGRLQGKDLGVYITISDFVLVPVVASLYDISSTVKFLQSITPIQKDIGFDVFGIINKKDRTLEHEVISSVEGHANMKFFKSSISNWARYKRLSTIEDIVSPSKQDDEFNVFYKEFLTKTGL
tara:strand:- start:2623 stop:3264 length:642 start_codon:yes stop_codon:yes gene_type:complete